MKQYLRHYISVNQTNWDVWLPTAIFSYNTTVHSSTKFTPYELVYGRKPEIPSALTAPVEFRYTYDDYVEELKLKLREAHECARKNLIESKEINKYYFDKKTEDVDYKVGDFVYLQNNQSKTRRCKKLSPGFTGPYEVVALNPPVNISLKIKNKRSKKDEIVLVHVNRVKPAHGVNQ